MPWGATVQNTCCPSARVSACHESADLFVTFTMSTHVGSKGSALGRKNSYSVTIQHPSPSAGTSMRVGQTHPCWLRNAVTPPPTTR